MTQKIKPQAAAIPQCFMDLYNHAKGLKSGADWNHGTQAKFHRGPLSRAVKECEEYLNAAQPEWIDIPDILRRSND